jgi:hypothetical protein
MNKLFSNLARFWSEDRSLTVMLLLLLLFIFILIPFISPGHDGQILLKIIYSVILFTGILSVSKHKTFVRVISILAVIGLSASWSGEITSTRFMVIANDSGAILFNFFFAIAILIKTFQPGDITIHRIVGSIVVYLLLGLIFCYSFHAVYLLAGPTTFNNIKESGLKEFLYFSFTSLTTMGYGDITPVHPMARSLANLEGLIGQLYPAILIARLISMEFEASSWKREKK